MRSNGPIRFASRLARLMTRGSAILIAATAFAAEPQAAQDPDALLQRIRTRMAEHLAQLPNYTCHEMINRMIRRANSGSFEHRDQVELEVAFVGSRELYARPGESQFDDQPIQKIVPAGTISSGLFGSSANAVFLREGAAFKYVGPSKKDGHQTFRYDFQVPEDKSGFLVRHDSAEGIVAYKGSFWVDSETLDLVRLELKTERIPSRLGVRSIEETMKYELVRVRQSDFLLPHKSQVAAFDDLGNYSLNMISLEQCREFAGESKVSYDTPVDGTSVERQSPDR